MNARATIFLVALTLVSTTALADGWAIGSGATHWSGSMSLSLSKGDLYEDGKGNSQTFVSAAISGHYFIVPHVAAGLRGTFANFQQGETSASMLSIGPVVGVFLGGRRTNSFPYLLAGYDHLNATYKQGSHGHSWNIGVGVLSMVSAKFGVSVEMTTSFIELKTDDSSQAFDIHGGPVLARVNDDRHTGFMIGLTVGLVGASF